MFLRDGLQAHLSSNSIRVVGKCIHNFISGWLISLTYFSKIVRFWNLEIFEYLDIWITEILKYSDIGMMSLILSSTEDTQHHKVNQTTVWLWITIKVIEPPERKAQAWEASTSKYCQTVSRKNLSTWGWWYQIIHFLNLSQNNRSYWTVPSST